MLLLLLFSFWVLTGANVVYPSKDCTHNSNPKIVIIGAGASGIACATKLLEYGFENVQILEAEPRIGGRVYTIPFGLNVVDLGAQWCHGEKDNVVYELASKYDLLETSGEFDYQCVRSNQEVLPPEVDRKLKAIVNGIEENQLTEMENYNGSYGSYLTDKFYDKLKTPENADIDQTLADEFFVNFKKMQCVLEASDNLEEVSVHSDYWNCEGDEALQWKGKGYKTFLKLLMKADELGSELGTLEKHVTLSKPVTKINWDNDRSNVEIICIDGDIIKADHVIVTVSLGVLKEQHARLFEPQLPPAKIRSIDGLAFGTVNKIYLEFAKPFWPANWTGFSLLWRDEDLADIRGTPRAWLEAVLGFYTVSYQPNLLQGWIIGPHGRYMETLSKEEINARCMFALRKFLSWEIPNPINIKNTAWFTNSNFRGTYSYRAVHTDEFGGRAIDLAEPLLAKGGSCKKPIVQFAGEATSEHHYSTVHGATETGWREARVLADFYNKVSGKESK